MNQAHLIRVLLFFMEGLVESSWTLRWPVPYSPQLLACATIRSYSNRSWVEALMDLGFPVITVAIVIVII